LTQCTRTRNLSVHHQDTVISPVEKRHHIIIHRGEAFVEITEVRVMPCEEDKLKAFASITLDNCFVVRGLKVIAGAQGYFISMPSRRRKDGSFQDIAHPITNDMRKRIEDKVLDAYEAELGHEEGNLVPAGSEEKQLQPV
jgi:stage V sporulation protein G